MTDVVALTPELTLAQWERQAGALAKAKPTSVADALRALEKAHDAVPWALRDIEGLQDVAAAELRVAQLRNEGERRVRVLAQQAEAAGQAASKWLAGARKGEIPKPALQAAEALSRGAATWGTMLERAWQTSLEAAQRQLEVLRTQAQQQAAAEPADTPERRRVRARVIDQFRLVKNRPDVKVMFLLCVGHRSCAPYLGPSAADSLKPLLAKVLQGDTGLKYFRGECIWEESAYTFVGPRMSKTIARRIEDGLLELTGTRWRVRAHE